MSSGTPGASLQFPCVNAQYANALLTSMTHPDLKVRERAKEKATKWSNLINGIASGEIAPGERRPTKYPAWVTLEVLWGGFSSGKAMANSPPSFDERAQARNLLAEQGLPDEEKRGISGQELVRETIFAHYLTHQGQKELVERLSSGAYRIEIPEDAALLCIAWLQSHGHHAQAVEVLKEIGPYASHLRFSPHAAPPSAIPAGHAWRMNAEEAAGALRDRRAKPRVERQREMLTVWNPLADEFLALWYPLLRQNEDGPHSLDLHVDKVWLNHARSLVTKYDKLVSLYKPTFRRVVRSSSSLASLVNATRYLLKIPKGETLVLDKRLNGRVLITLKTMVAKRGPPNSKALGALRTRQARIAAKPSTAKLAATLAARLENDRVNPFEGLIDPASFAYPVTETEAETHGVPAGAHIEGSLRHTLDMARAAPVTDLVESGDVPSSEVFAKLLPRLVAANIVQDYDDASLGRLMAAHHIAFRERRSLLLVNLQHQVRVGELPWAAACMAYQKAKDPATAGHDRLLQLVCDITITQWPGTIMANTLVSQVNAIVDPIGTDAQALDSKPIFLEELAADIFQNKFSPKFARAARAAVPVIENTLYAKYFDINTPQLQLLTDDENGREEFNQMCHTRSETYLGTESDSNHIRWTVSNGSVIEQAQILTTHNLATLAQVVQSPGAWPASKWAGLARGAWKQVIDELNHAQRSMTQHSSPLRHVKNCAYAWRQTLFYLSQAERSSLQETTERAKVKAEDSSSTDPDVKPVKYFLEKARSDIVELGGWREKSLLPLLGGLEDVLAGRDFSPEGISPNGRRFTGWVNGSHWVLEQAAGEVNREREAKAAAEKAEREARLAEDARNKAAREAREAKYAEEAKQKADRRQTGVEDVKEEDEEGE